MIKIESEMKDYLRSEHDLKSLQVRQVGSGRKSFTGMSTNNVLNIIREDVTQGVLSTWESSDIG